MSALLPRHRVRQGRPIGSGRRIQHGKLEDKFIFWPWRAELDAPQRSRSCVPMALAFTPMPHSGTP